MSVVTPTDRMPLRRGLALEYTTLAWNVAGTVVLILAALAAGSVGLAVYIAEPTALVILVCGLREARHAWAEAA